MSTIIENRPSPQEQLELLRDDVPLVKDDSWFILSKEWINTWQDYCSNSPSVDDETHRKDWFFPGVIDNRGLLTQENEVSAHLLEQADFDVLPKSKWDLLVSWYGTNAVIERKVIEVEQNSIPILQIEIRLKKFSVYKDTTMAEPVSVLMSKVSTLNDLKQQIVLLLKIPQTQNIKLYSMSDLQKDRLLTPELDKQLFDISALCGDDVSIFVETDYTQSAVPLTTIASSGTSKFPGTGQQVKSPTSSFTSFSNYAFGSRRTTPGVCGLSNLGNTCFMNSALQCLNNTVPLAEYFLEKRHEEDMNRTNPLGTRGEVADQYAHLVQVVWSGTESSFSPRDFKWTIGRFNHQFAGTSQHDSQELLGFLLDGLHEDLNRIIKKPYIEDADTDDRPEREVADEAWEYHKKRNDSVIVDLFQGQFRSRVTCPDCKKVSTKFDPSMYLSLPLPIANMKKVDVMVLFHDAARKPLLVRVDVPKVATIGVFRERLAELVHVDATKLILGELYQHKLYQIYQDQQGLSSLRDNDKIIAFEVTAAVPIPVPSYSSYSSRYDDKSKAVVSDVINVRFQFKLDDKSYLGNFFGLPLILTLPKETTFAFVSDEIKKALRRFIEVPETDTDADRFDMTITYGSYQGDTLHPNSDVIKLDAAEIYTVCFPQRVYNRFFQQHLTDGSFKIEIDKHESLAEAISAKADITLKQCLNLFGNSSRLSKDNAWYCPKCKEHKEASKQMDLWRLPRILVIHLKRFSFTTYSRDKIDAYVDFPLTELDLSEFASGPQEIAPIYDLFAVSNHYGGMGGGHYTAYAKNKIDKNWYNFNDSSASVANANSVKSEAAYVLFYERRQPSQ